MTNHVWGNYDRSKLRVSDCGRFLQPMTSAPISAKQVLSSAAVPAPSKPASRADLAVNLRNGDAAAPPNRRVPMSSNRVERAFALRALISDEGAPTSRSDRAFALREQHQTS